MFIHQVNRKGELGRILRKHFVKKSCFSSAFKSRLSYIPNAEWTEVGQAMPADSPK